MDPILLLKAPAFMPQNCFRYIMTINKTNFERKAIFRGMERGFKSSTPLNKKDYYDVLGVGRNSS